MAENTRRMNNEPVFGSLAYDLNTLNWGEFDGNAVRQPQEQPQEPLRRPERRERPRQEPRRRPAARPREHASPVMLAGVAVLLMMVVVLMMGYIRLMQASHDVTVKQAQLQQAQEDNVALGVAYEKAFDQSAVKAAAVYLFFTFVIQAVGYVPDVLSIISDAGNLFNAYISVPVLNDIVTLVKDLIYLAEKIFLMVLGVKALNQGTVAVPFVDKLVVKYL